MEMIAYTPQPEPVPSLKHQLVSAVARGDEIAAQELRLLLKMTAPERIGEQRRRKAR